MQRDIGERTKECNCCKTAFISTPEILNESQALTSIYHNGIVNLVIELLLWILVYFHVWFLTSYLQNYVLETRKGNALNT